MAERRPLLAALERRAIFGVFMGQRERGPIVGALMRMTPEARGAFLGDLAFDTLIWAASLGMGRVLMRVLDLNISEFLGRVPRGRGAS